MNTCADGIFTKAQTDNVLAQSLALKETYEQICDVYALAQKLLVKVDKSSKMMDLYPFEQNPFEQKHVVSSQAKMNELLCC